jgi:DNA excision repair protein ERCC-2
MYCTFIQSFFKPVVRTPSDRGVLHLIDDRFARPEVLRLLPAWWQIEAPA